MEAAFWAGKQQVRDRETPGDVSGDLFLLRAPREGEWEGAISCTIHALVYFVLDVLALRCAGLAPVLQ